MVPHFVPTNKELDFIEKTIKFTGAFLKNVKHIRCYCSWWMLTLAVIEYWSRSIFYAHRFVGKDAGACNQHSWHHTSHIQICKQLIVRWSTRAWFLYVWDLLQLFERWRLGISRCLTAYQDPSTVCAQSQLIFVPWMVEQFVLITLCFFYKNV